MMTKYTVLVVGDNDNLCSQVCDQLKRHSRFDVKAQAYTLQSAKGLLESNTFDAVLVDTGIEDNGVEIIKKIDANACDTKCLVMSDHDDREVAMEVFRSGANGYILKKDAVNSVCDSMLQMMSGGSPVSPSIANYLLDTIRAEKGDVEVKNDAKLTKRESEVLQLVAMGYSYTEIAESLSLSYHTISTYIKIIYSKLSVCSRGAAVYEAIRSGLISVNQSQSA